MSHAPDPVDQSVTLLRAARTGETETVTAVWRDLAARDSTALAASLSDDDRRTAFWLNVYNAAVQDDLREDASRYDSRLRFFFGDRVTVAGHRLSLNDIEHGILRRSKSLFGLGYLPRLRPSAFERTHRVAALDARIHFALNCGATSCPPIAAYSAATLDEELALATRSYLDTEVAYDPDAGVVRVPQLFLWYRGDFGGRSGIRDYLRTYGPLPDDASPRIRYRSYDWSLDLENFLDLDAADADAAAGEATVTGATTGSDGAPNADAGDRAETRGDPSVGTGN
jgi:hypothetical protein